MIKRGRIVVIGDEYLEMVALAAGVDAYVFDEDCKKLLNWLVANIESYDVVIHLDSVTTKCRDVGEFLEREARERMVLPIGHPMKGVYRSPKEYYREITKRVLGVEISL